MAQLQLTTNPTFRKTSMWLLQAWFRNCSVRQWVEMESVDDLQDVVSGETEDVKCDFTGVPHCSSD